MGEKARLERQIAQLAARQHGQVTRAQLLALGMARASIPRWVEIGRLHRAHRGVYSVGRPAVTPLERAMAAVLACGPGAVLSHGSALTLWGIWKRWDTPFEVSIAGDRRPKRIRVHRAQALDRRDVTRHLGIPVTTLTRTLLDQAPRMNPKSLTRAINTGRQDHQLQLRALVGVVSRNPGHRGCSKLEAVLGRAPERPTRSQFEDDFPGFCERHGLPQPQMGALVCGYEVDAVFAEEKVIVELDSWLFHSSRVSFEGDRNRDADTLAGGFETLRLTWERYRREPEREAERLHAILARRRRRRPRRRRRRAA